MVLFIDAETALSLLERAVEEKGPDYDYLKDTDGRYAYFDEDGSPSCILGHVFSYLGDGGVNSVLRMKSGTIFEACGLDDYIEYDSEETKFALEDAQDAQDTNKTWGFALQRAKERLGQV